jgi:hypothetical protein
MGLEATRLILLNYWDSLEARVGIEPTHKGFADLSLTTWVPRLGGLSTSAQVNCRRSVPQTGILFGAGDRGRTGDIFLGKEALYH